MSLNKKNVQKKHKKIQINYSYKKKRILYDRILLWLILGLSAVGFIMVASASMPLGQRLYDDPFFFAKRELFYFFIVFCLSLLFLRIPMIFWKENSESFILISIFLLCMVLLAGESINGALRWIKIGFIHLQPSEFCKISSLCYISNYLSQNFQEVKYSFWSVLKLISILVIQSILLLSEPDLGTIIVLFSTYLAMLFLSGIKIEQLLIIISICIIMFIFLIILEPYRLKRILSFWNPCQDPFGSGYQLIQSLIAIERGQFFGQGLGHSIQKLSYLPESHSDFIFSIIGEEIGCLGSVSILSMICFLSLRAMNIGKKALKQKNIFSGFLACSIGILISTETFINIGTVTGLLPTKGLTLPFISYGGSSLIMTFIAVFFLLRIDFENRSGKIKHFLTSKK